VFESVKVSVNGWVGTVLSRTIVMRLPPELPSRRVFRLFRIVALTTTLTALGAATIVLFWGDWRGAVAILIPALIWGWNCMEVYSITRTLDRWRDHDKRTGRDAEKRD